MTGKFNKENMLMLKLLFVLLKKLKFFIKKFEEDDLEITEVVQFIKLSHATMGEYLFNLNNNDADFYSKLANLIQSEEDSDIYKQSLRPDTEFEAYFLK